MIPKDNGCVVIDISERSKIIHSVDTFEDYPPTLSYVSCTHINNNLISNIFKSEKCDENKSRCIITQIIAINNPIHVCIPNLYELDQIDEDPPFEQPVYTSWVSTHQKSKILCSNCWLSLLPYLQILLQHICNHIHQYDTLYSNSNYKNMRIPQKCIRNEITLFHLDFMNDIMKYRFIIKHIMQNNQMSQYFFIWYADIMKMFFLSNLLYPKFVYDTLIHETLDMFVQHYFLSTSIFWNDNHRKYLQYLKKIIEVYAFKYAITIEEKYNATQDMSTHYSDVLHILRLLLLIKYSLGFEPICKDDELLVRYFVRCSHYFSLISRHLWNVETVSFSKDMDVHVVIDKVLWFYVSVKYHNDTLHALLDKQKAKKLVKKLQSEYLKLLRRKVICNNPLCVVNKNEQKFYKCKGCKMAIYCSKHCQKIHWNRYHHKQQCIGVLCL
eukprot:116673_1